MFFKQFLHEEGGCASYLIASSETRDAIVVDPQYDAQQYVELAAERGFTIRHIVDTHIHADHLSGNRQLAELTGAAVRLHAKANVAFPHCRLEDGDQLQVGRVEVRVLHTPGHRPESICLLVTNHERSSEPGLVLTGDTLFVGDVGRPDFGGPSGAMEQFHSTRRLLDLADWVEMFPAHFEGACGRSMCGRPSSTIGFERRYNPMLQLEEADFIRVAAEPSPRPLNMTAILATNEGRADYRFQPGAATVVDSLSAEAAPSWITEHHACIVDVREPWEYAAGHIPAALSVPQAELALALDRLSRERNMLIVCQSGIRSARAARFLKSSGFSRVANLSGGMLAWLQAGNPAVNSTDRAQRPRRRAVRASGG